MCGTRLMAPLDVLAPLGDLYWAVATESPGPIHETGSWQDARMMLIRKGDAA